MLTSDSSPLEWASLMYELEDAKEHLGHLIGELNTTGEISEHEYESQLAHIYSHLNRSWASRHHIGEISDKQREEYSKFPHDIKPL